MKRANIGCGNIRPAGWENYDNLDLRERVLEVPGVEHWDIRQPLLDTNGEAMVEVYDYAVLHHVLSALDHHELVPALDNIRTTLKRGARLRVSDIDVMQGFSALIRGDEAWFPQDERTGSIDAKFCTWATWFGTHKSIFNPIYLTEMLYGAGFEYVDTSVAFGLTRIPDPGAMDLDARKTESIYLEAVA